jgi:hypothetical protein
LEKHNTLQFYPNKNENFMELLAGRIEGKYPEVCIDTKKEILPK